VRYAKVKLKTNIQLLYYIMNRLLDLAVIFALLLVLGGHRLGYGQVETERIYKGTADEVSIVAYAAQSAPDSSDLVTFSVEQASADQITLLYRGFENIEAVEPLVIVGSDSATTITVEPKQETGFSDVEYYIEDATVTGGRVGAICEDGSRSDATGRGACSHHGGVSRWLYSERPDRSATVAAICADYMLVSGDGSDCKGDVLVEIKNKEY
jgi:hypothetical protein